MFFNNYKKKTDEELMRLVQHGNQQALTVLYERYHQLLMRYFYRMLWKDRQKAQDFLQDIFIKVIESGAGYNPERKFSTWIYSVAHNMCKNEYRKQAFRQAIHEYKGFEVIDDPVEMAIEESNERKMVLEKAIRDLGVEDKNLYVLRYELEMSIEEMAQCLDCPAGTVKSKLFYFKKKLSTIVESHYQIKKQNTYGK